MTWYVTAFDIAGDIWTVEGPMSWSDAQATAKRLREDELVASTTIGTEPRKNGKRTQYCECGNVKPTVRAEACDECKRIDEARLARTSLASTVKTLLERHYPDWLDGAEIRALVNDEESSAALWKLRRRGEIEQRRNGAGAAYRAVRRAA